ncbi:MULTISPECIES: VanW family protein [Mesobacillus]|uniref:G5 domain-containing protein n=1 Tax=Mesobacillus selenatarsenatis TaxID=388741 RepID=A0A846TLA7_9BACI|nr:MULTISPECIES: VanW family protein [Mesobacillus]NKE06382.1 hypothetical protein [Mesobacillus selenatarsenatis]
MKKQHIIKFSLILSVFSIFIFSFTYFGASAFGSRASSNQIFSEKTSIGNVDVSNKTPEEAKALIEAKVNEWAQAAQIKLLYKGETYAIDPLHFVFLLDESVAAAQNGVQNDLLVELKGGALSSLELPETVRSQLDDERLVNDLSNAGKGLILVSDFSLENYLPEEKPVTITRSSLKLPEKNSEIKELAEAIQKMEIAPESHFSLANYARENNLSETSSYAYSQIASALYKALLSTNFTIGERHISSELAVNIELGFESKVDLSKNLDLKFYNPNKTSYTLELSIDNEELLVTITGAPLLYEYTVKTSNKQEFKPRTIKQYSPLLKTGQKSVESEGKPGFLITVSREIHGRKGELLETEFISEDFYTPVHRVEIYPIAPAVQQTPPATGTNDGTVTEPNAVQTLPPSVPVEQTGNNNNSTENSSDGTSGQDGIANENDDDGSLWGKPDEQPK